MVPKLASISYFLSLAVSILAPNSSAQDSNTCYVPNGRKTYDSGYRCNNITTGHSACCGEGAVCYSNGLCQQFNGPMVDFLRVGCTDRTWQDPACFTQCAYRVRFCNVSVETSTSYCCDDGSQGVGSFHCCENPRSIFRLSPAGTFLAQMPLSQLFPSATSFSRTSPASTSATISPALVTGISTSPSDDGGSSNTVVIGAALGVSGAIISIGLVGLSLWRRKRNAKQNKAFELQHDEAARGPVYRHDSISLKAFEVNISPVTPKAYPRASDHPAATQEVPSRNKAYELGA
ncbi:uncharacterized protein RAG0_14212 [Rhynchosporium agropyri]|uniref:Uncharacterized protein n=1 Tax=Rhynchosporium agropyri TaxID=914238 RepID=A0A1E1LG66_9HELO|nr:uncharacterized protein RAG0_14212 [Rhynchosporium agropyri]